MFYKKDALENLAKFTGKHLCHSLFFNKVAGLRSTPGDCFSREFIKPGMALCRVSKGMASLLLVIYSSNLFHKCFVLVQSYERWGCVSSSILQKEKRNELIFRNLKSTLSKCETLLDSVSLVSPKYTYINYSKPITSCFAFFSNNFFNKSYIKWNINSHCKNIISNK